MTVAIPNAADHKPSGELLGLFANGAPVQHPEVGVDPVDWLPDNAGGPARHQPLPDAPLQREQATPAQRRATACGGRRKTQPTVRDELTTTFHGLGAVNARRSLSLRPIRPRGTLASLGLVVGSTPPCRAKYCRECMLTSAANVPVRSPPCSATCQAPPPTKAAVGIQSHNDIIATLAKTEGTPH